MRTATFTQIVWRKREDNPWLLAGAEAERLKPQVIAALTETLTPFVRGDGVWAPSSTWFITATNAG